MAVLLVVMMLFTLLVVAQPSPVLPMTSSSPSSSARQPGWTWLLTSSAVLPSTVTERGDEVDEHHLPLADPGRTEASTGPLLRECQ